MKKLPLISINIPTYNEEKALLFALESISKQTYPNLEIIVIDSDSRDNTKKIAIDFGVRVINYPDKLLGARYMGVQASNGDYILFLDADQILNETAIERAFQEIENYDMLIFEENSYKPETYIQKAIAKERKMLHSNENSLDPVAGGLLPRFFKKDILIQSFENIPEELYPIVVAHDHAIIYFEAYKISQNMGIVNNAVLHIEPGSFYELIVHFYRFGKSTKQLAKTGFYKEIFSEKSDIKKNSSVNLIGISLMLIFRSLAYRLGYYFG